MNDNDKKKQIKKKLTPLKLNNINTKKYLTESKKDEINQENSSKSFLNSMRYITKFNDSSSFDSLKLHIIKNPYKIFLPIKTKMKTIKNNREIVLNNYYKISLRNDFYLRDIINTESNNSNANFSKKNIIKNPIYNISINKSTDISKSNRNNISKNAAILNTDRTSTSIDIPAFNLSNISRIKNYDKYNIFSYNSKRSNNEIYNKSNISDIDQEHKALRFLDLNQGYKNLPSLKSCVKNFTNEIKNLRKERYINYYLKEKQYTVKDDIEFNHDNYKMEIRQKLKNKKLLEIFYKDYNTYYHKLKKKEEKDTDKINLLKWHIISYKNEVNRLNIKKDKLLARLNKYIKMKQFLIKMRNYSLDLKDDSFIYDKSNKYNNQYKDLIKERRINESNENQKNPKTYRRKGSVDFSAINKIEELKLNDDDKEKKIQIKRLRRLNSAKEKNLLVGSAVKEISTILNNHISNLLIYQNQLRIDLEPLKEEFDNLYKSLKESVEKKNKLLKLQFLILPEKKRIAKERNEFLINTLTNIKNNIYNSLKYNRFNKTIREKLDEIYKLLIDNKIIKFSRLKASYEDNNVEKIYFYLKNIEKGINILISNKKYMKDNYQDLYNDIIKEINDKIKLKALEAQKNKDLNGGHKKINSLNNKMKNNLILNRRNDYYNFVYKKEKKKIAIKKVNPYEELIYSDDNDSNEEKNYISKYSK